MRYSEYKGMCRKAWSETFNYLCTDMTKNKNDGKYRIFNKSKKTYIECIPESELPQQNNCCIQLKTENISKN